MSPSEQTWRGQPPGRLRVAKPSRSNRLAGRHPLRAIGTALFLLLSALPAKTATSFSIEADLRDFVLLGIPDPFPAIPIHARIDVTYDETAPHSEEIGTDGPVKGGGRIYTSAVDAFSVELFDGSGASLGQGIGSDTSITILDGLFGVTDAIRFQSLNMTGLPPFSELSLEFEGPDSLTSSIDLALLTPEVLDAYPVVTATVAGFPESDLARLVYVPRDGAAAIEQPAPIPLQLPGLYLLTGLGLLPMASLAKRRRHENRYPPETDVKPRLRVPERTSSEKTQGRRG